jgi:hypothetical protein
MLFAHVLGIGIFSSELKNNFRAREDLFVFEGSSCLAFIFHEAKNMENER